MTTKNVYQFDIDNKTYKGVITLDDTDKSPSGNWNIPGDCTTVKPPAEKENYIPVWNGEKWVETEDYRKKEYWLPEDKYGAPGREVKEIGPLPEGATLTPPEQTLEEVKEAKKAALKAERDLREQGVLTYNGKGFDYDLKSVAKLNEARDVLIVDGGSQAWICADSSITTLTADDITEIKRLGKERSNDLHMQYAALKIYVESLTDKEAVEAVTFDTEIDIAAQINLP